MGADGILNINKPPGKTSFSIVSLVRKLSGAKRVGHAGTLDPLATGILPLCLNRATRVIEFLVEQPKTYLAQIELGTVTDTYDAAGKVIQKSEDLTITLEQLQETLFAFQGTIEQRPPMHSALRCQGQRLYHLARAGLNVEVQPRKVKIYNIELISFELPLLTIEIDCGKGTYIRALAHDLGQELGCGAYLKNLSRVKYGPFTLGESLSLPLLEKSFKLGQWQNLLRPMDIALMHLPYLIVSGAEATRIRNGCPIPNTTQVQTEWPSVQQTSARAYTEQGHFIALLLLDKEREEWRPRKVFSSHPH